MYNSAIYYNNAETDNTLLSYRTGSYIDYNVYNRNETDNLLAN